MKILKAPQSDWTALHICERCRAELEVEANDLSASFQDGDGPYPGGWVYTAECPVNGCNAILYVDTKSAPPYVLIQAQQRSKTSFGGR